MAIEDSFLHTAKAEPLEAVSRRIRDGDLLLCSAYDPFSKLIGWATKSPWSHVALAYRWPHLGRIMVFEAVQSIGVRTVPIGKFISQSSTGQLDGAVSARAKPICGMGRALLESCSAVISPGPHQ